MTNKKQFTLLEIFQLVSENISTFDDCILVNFANLINQEVISRETNKLLQEKIEVKKEDAKIIAAKVAAKETEKQEEKAKQALIYKLEQDAKAIEKNKEALKIKYTWECKSAIVNAIYKWGYIGEFNLNIWSNENDRRVYFQGGTQDRKGNWTWKYCLYLTGNKYNQPNKLDALGEDCFFDKNDNQIKLKALLIKISQLWKADLKINSTDFTSESDYNEKQLNSYLDVLNISKQDN